MNDIAAKQKALEFVVATDKEFLSPAEIAPILGVDPHNIRLTARYNPERLKFEVIVVGNRTKIPRVPFLQYLGIDINNLEPTQKPQPTRSPYNREPMTNEELLLLITYQINSLKKDLNDRLDDIERQSKDINDVLQSARHFVNTLSGYNPRG